MKAARTVAASRQNAASLGQDIGGALTRRRYRGLSSASYSASSVHTNQEFNSCSLPRRRFPFAAAADFLQALAHIVHTVANR